MVEGILEKKEIPDIKPGDTVRVRFKEFGGDRVQVFEGIVIKMKKGVNITLRHTFQGIGVERTFPLNSPLLEGIEVVKRGRARRAKLFFIRRISEREIRRKIKPR